ncbi:S-layer homology domain-containing protein [Paenibacillus rhizoplanae]
MALINRAFGFTETAPVAYKDLSASNWAYTEVAKAVKAGYISGYSDGTIGTGKTISRQEAAVIIHRLLKLDAAKTGALFQ